MVTPFDWDKLRIFHAAAEAGSFTHAAQKLHLSQSAISRQVNSLEFEIGVPLFQRHARGLVLTEQGEILYRSTEHVFLELKNVYACLKESQNKPRGPLCVTTTAGMGLGWLIERIAEFSELYPDIQIHLLLDDKEVNLTMRHADCAIRLHQPQQPDLIQKKLFTVHMHIYASPQYIENYGMPKSLVDLAQHRLITFGDKVPIYLSALNWLESARYAQGVKSQSFMQINNLIAIKTAVQRGLGLAILPDYMIKETDDLVILLPEYSNNIPTFNTFFCYPDFLKHSAKLHAFRDFIFTKARQWSY